VKDAVVKGSGVNDLPSIVLGRDALAGFDAASSREWLVTNGIGGYAAGTAGGAPTRRYHGLLVAALKPPVERTVMVAKLDVLARYGSTTVPLSTSEFADGTVAPDGYRYLAEFRLEGTLPVWTWLVGDAVVEQRVWMPHGRNTTFVSFCLRRGSAPVDLTLQPLCTWRDYHWHRRGGGDFQVRPVPGGIEVTAGPGARPYRLVADRGEVQVAPDWYWNIRHREEGARGLDDREDLFRPAIFQLRLTPGESVTLALTTEDAAAGGADDSLEAEQIRQLALLGRARPAADAPAWVPQLVLAADQYLVARGTGPTAGQTVIAGYPWFSDWGRDTMIALPGLTLATGRPEAAASILRTFARHVSDGMLPNRFPDAGEAPEYNTVDATLWYFVAVDAYLRATGDAGLRRDLYPLLKDIVAWHQRGTRYQIRVDEADGLLRAGEPGVQLTWMDAKVGDWVVTPRSGKCVEINALWFNALKIMEALAAGERDGAGAREYAAAAARVLASFDAAFWDAAGGYLCDVVDGTEGEQGTDGRRRDRSLRPNQIFAASLPHPLLDAGRRRQVVDVCARELWTPVGLRSLAPRDPRYLGTYRGGPRERDGAYHQGTVWSWLLGPFVSAHYRAYGDADAALRYLDGVPGHLREACIGQTSEIFDGDAPYAPRGCFAQAWGVAELLRTWSEINERESGQDHSPQAARTGGSRRRRAAQA
jgi:predicted glycogen debranching enzyme